MLVAALLAAVAPAPLVALERTAPVPHPTARLGLGASDVASTTPRPAGNATLVDLLDGYGLAPSLIFGGYFDATNRSFPALLSAGASSSFWPTDGAVLELAPSLAGGHDAGIGLAPEAAAVDSYVHEIGVVSPSVSGDGLESYLFVSPLSTSSWGFPYYATNPEGANGTFEGCQGSVIFPYSSTPYIVVQWDPAYKVAPCGGGGNGDFNLYVVTPGSDGTVSSGDIRSLGAAGYSNGELPAAGGEINFSTSYSVTTGVLSATVTDPADALVGFTLTESLGSLGFGADVRVGSSYDFGFGGSGNRPAGWGLLEADFGNRSLASCGPPEIGLLAPALVGDEATLSGHLEAGGSACTISGLQVLWGDGTSSSPTGFPASHSYPGAGLYNGTAWVEQTNGLNASAPFEALVVPSGVCSPSLALTRFNVSAFNVTLDGNASGCANEGAISLRVLWGDGSVSEGAFPFTHQYAASGAFNATFVATQGDGGGNLTSVVLDAFAPAAFTALTLVFNTTSSNLSYSVRPSTPSPVDPSSLGASAILCVPTDTTQTNLQYADCGAPSPYGNKVLSYAVVQTYLFIGCNLLDFLPTDELSDEDLTLDVPAHWQSESVDSGMGDALSEAADAAAQSSGVAGLCEPVMLETLFGEVVNAVYQQLQTDAGQWSDSSLGVQVSGAPTIRAALAPSTGNASVAPWTFVLDGVAFRANASNFSIAGFLLDNTTTYGWSIPPVDGWTATPSSGTFDPESGNQTLVVSFSNTSAPASSAGGPHGSTGAPAWRLSALDEALLILGALVILVIIIVAASRRR